MRSSTARPATAAGLATSALTWVAWVAWVAGQDKNRHGSANGVAQFASLVDSGAEISGICPHSRR